MLPLQGALLLKHGRHGKPKVHFFRVCGADTQLKWRSASGSVKQVHCWRPRMAVLCWLYSAAPDAPARRAAGVELRCLPQRPLVRVRIQPLLSRYLWHPVPVGTITCCR